MVAVMLSNATLSAKDPVPLFNGKNLEGFETWLRASKKADPENVFSVVDGTIRISGNGFGYLATRRNFSNYHLKLEFRWGTQRGLNRKERKGKALDSGVFLHATGPHGNSHDGEGAYMAAIECNIFEGATGDILLIRGDAEDGREISPSVQVRAAKGTDFEKMPFWSANGTPITLKRWGRVNWFHKSKEWKDVRGIRGSRDIEKPPGEWNQLECICRDREITIILNGRIVNHVTQVHPGKGRILLQCEGAEIFYRALSLRQLGGNP